MIGALCLPFSYFAPSAPERKQLHWLHGHARVNCNPRLFLQVDLNAYEVFSEPRMVDILEIKTDKKNLGRDYKKDAKAICTALESMGECDAMELKAKLEAGETVALEADGSKFDITKDHVRPCFSPWVASRLLILGMISGSVHANFTAVS